MRVGLSRHGSQLGKRALLLRAPLLRSRRCSVTPTAASAAAASASGGVVPGWAASPEQLKASFDTFNKAGGKFRVAIIGQCNMRCSFCHNEGMDNPRVPGAAGKGTQRRKGVVRCSVEDMLAVMNAWCRLGGRQLNVTGGEPLLHKQSVDILRSIDKRDTRVVLNSNVLLANRLLKVPKIDALDAIYASLHTTSGDDFEEVLGVSKNSVNAVRDNMVALKQHGYNVQINFSLGPYNKDEFGNVMQFALENELDLKAIALIRPHEAPGFYGGDWVDPELLQSLLDSVDAQPVEIKRGFGGYATVYSIPGYDSKVEVKNVADGRLKTDFCNGCVHKPFCGEGMYALRSGVDGVWKPCLLRKERFSPIDTANVEQQVLENIHDMVGQWDNHSFLTGSPKCCTVSHCTD